MRTGDEHAVWLLQLLALEKIDPKTITGAIIASVVPQATFNLRRLCTRYFGVEPMGLGEPNVKYGIEIKGQGAGAEIGGASRRERGRQYVKISGDTETLKKKIKKD